MLQTSPIQRRVLEAGQVTGYASGAGLYPAARYTLEGVDVTKTVASLITRGWFQGTSSRYGGSVPAAITDAGRNALANLRNK